MGCVASWVAYSLIGKTAMKNMSPLPAVTYACVIGAACLFFPALHEDIARNVRHYSASVWLGVSYLGFFGSAIGFIWYYEGIKAIGPSRAGVFISLVPVSAILLASLILKEVIDFFSGRWGDIRRRWGIPYQQESQRVFQEGALKPEIADLQRQVQKNCDISDARHAGVYSLCSLLLRMRDLYKWEHRMVPWQEPKPADFMGWMEGREQYWEEIVQEEIAPLVLGGERFDPYDMAGPNVRLRPLGLVYGAGYGIGMKPTFFLAECAESRSVGGLRIDVVSRELARDIFMIPAMRRGEQIFARRSCMLFFLWDRILEASPSAREAMDFGLARYGVGLDEIRRDASRFGDLLKRIAKRELETWVYHEIGEVLETGFDSGLWRELVSAYANTPVEIFARALKDILADTHSEGLLGHIVQNRLESSLGFYVAFQRAISRMVFPEIREAFLRFRQTGDWSLIDAARESGQRNMHRYAAALTRLHREAQASGTVGALARIISEILEPLGIVKGARYNGGRKSDDGGRKEDNQSP